MSRLKMITQENPTPQNINSVKMKSLPRVYFAAHPKDYKGCRDHIAKDVFRTLNCAFCYDSQPELPYDDTILGDLENMNLFIVPITKRLLTDPVQRRVLEKDLPFAEKHHIPILPLMQQNGLECLYDNVEELKSRQALNEHAQDLTALTYTDKLASFLDSVLAKHSLRPKIQDAFSARIFLSYRKKDRDSAQKLMRTIHQDPALRDVAIWYDEFLTFGEDFNDEICEVIRQCNLFMLAVTPDLMENGNYVIRYEYPAALAEKKPVLPVRMLTEKPVQKAFCQTFLTSEQETERAAIQELVLDMVDITDADSVCNAVKESLERVLGNPLTENHSPEQQYLMGVAYLEGIDVEVDSDQAIPLLTRSAEEGYAPAMLELVRIYTDGRGVKKNLETALNWQMMLANWYQEAYEQTKQESLLETTLNLQDGVVHLLHQMNEPIHLEAADTLCTLLLKDYETYYTPEENPQLFAKTYMHQSVILFDLNQKHHARARKCLENGLHLARQAYLAAGESPEERRTLLFHYAMGAESCIKHGYNDTALSLLQQGQDLYGDAWDTEDDTAFLRIKAVMLDYQGRITKRISALRDGLAIFQRLEKHKEDPGNYRLASNICLEIAKFLMCAEDSHKQSKDKEIKESLKLAEKYARNRLKSDKSDDALSQLCKALCLQIEFYGQLSYRKTDLRQKACQRLERDVLAHLTDPQAPLAYAYRVLGQWQEDLGDMAKLENSKRDAKTHYANAEKHYQQSLSTFQLISANTSDDVIPLGQAYSCLGMLYAKQGKDQEAQTCFKNNRQLLEDWMAPIRASKDDWKDFLSSDIGQNVMDAYIQCYAEAASKWVERCQNNGSMLVYGNWAKELLREGLERAMEWELATPNHRVYWSTITLYVLQERLSWVAKEYDLGYRSNESILQYHARLEHKNQNIEQRFLELKTQYSMGMQARNLDLLLGVKTKTSAKMHFAQAELLAKGLLQHFEDPEVELLLHNSQFYQALYN